MTDISAIGPKELRPPIYIYGLWEEHDTYVVSGGGKELIAALSLSFSRRHARARRTRESRKQTQPVSPHDLGIALGRERADEDAEAREKVWLSIHTDFWLIHLSSLSEQSKAGGRG